MSYLRFALLMAILLSGRAFAGDDYDKAVAQSTADALDPLYRQWYLQTLRPAVGAVLAPLLGRCGIETHIDDLETIGLVFIVTREGTVSRMLWATETPLTDCLERDLQTRVFPASPKDEFFMGVQVNYKANRPDGRS